MTHGDKVKLGIFNVEFIKTNHSIADAAALAITTPAGVIVHTGDFKIDHTPLFGEAIDLARFAELGSKGVLALMADSTNVERQGYTPSEKNVGKTSGQSVRRTFKRTYDHCNICIERGSCTAYHQFCT
mgnify:FL=1